MAPTSTSKTPRWWRIMLPASIVLNLFFIALIGGFWLHHRRANQEIAGTFTARILTRADAILPPKDATAFGAVIRRDAPAYEEAQNQLVQARREVQHQLIEEHLDQAGLRQALANWQQAWDHFADDFGGTLVEALSQISFEGRRKLVAERRLHEAAGH